MADQWLKCNVFKGMFSDELAVKVRQTEGGFAAFFVPKSLVEGSIDHEGKVRVRVFHEGPTAWAVIPAENAPTIPVEEADLLAA